MGMAYKSLIVTLKDCVLDAIEGSQNDVSFDDKFGVERISDAKLVRSKDVISGDLESSNFSQDRDLSQALDLSHGMLKALQITKNDQDNQGIPATNVCEAKKRKLRLVEGRLQVVGFDCDIPVTECTRSSMAWRNQSRMARSNRSTLFWDEVISLMMQ